MPTVLINMCFERIHYEAQMKKKENCIVANKLWYPTIQGNIKKDHKAGF